MAARSPSRSPATRSCSPTATRSRRRPASPCACRPERVATLRVPLAPARRRLRRAASRSRRRRFRARCIPGSTDDRVLGAHFNAFAYRAVRIAFDVSPLSHPATGVGNYIRGSLARLLEAAGGEHEIVAFAPTSLRGPGAHPEALAGIDVELRTWPLPASHAVRTAWSIAGHPAAERLLGRLRRAPLHRLDVPAAAGRRARDDDPRPRPAAVPGVDDEAHAGDARAQVRERGPHLRRDLRQLRLHRARRDRAARCRAGSGSASRRRASRPCSPPAGRPPTSARRTSSPSPRSSRARTCRRSPRRTALLGGDLLLAVVGRRGLGRAAGARRSARAPARLRLRRGAGRGCTAAPPLPSTRRASRGSGCRSSRRWPAARPSSPRPTPRMDEACGRRRRARRSRRPRRDRGRDRGGDRASASGCVAAGLAHAARFTWRATGEAMLRGLRGGAVRVGLDVAPLVQTGAGTARVVRGLLGALAGRPGLELSPLSLRRPRARRDRCPRRGLVPGRHRPRGARRSTSSTARRCAARCAPARPSSSPCTISPCCGIRRRSRPGTGTRVALALRHGVRARRRGRRGLGVHARRARRAARASRSSGCGSSRTASTRSSPLRPGSERRLRARRRDARAAQEPRPRRRGGRARRRRAARRRRPGLGRSRGARLGRPCRRRGARRALPGCALPRLPVALRGLRAPGAGGDGLRHARRDEPRRRDRGGRRRRRRARRPARARVDRGRDRRGGAAVATSSSRSASSGPEPSPGRGPPTPSRPSGGSSHERAARRRRRRRPRPAAHRRRDLRAQPAARAARRSPPLRGCGSRR